jgi:hypothetical protein
MLEIVYRDRDNSIDFILKANTLTDPIKKIVDLTDITRMMLVREDGFKIDSAKNDSIFDWTTLAASGIVSIQLGLVDIKSGIDIWRLIVFDATNTNGLAWGEDFYLDVKKRYADR